MEFTFKEPKQKKTTISFDNAPYSYMNNNEYDVNKVLSNIAVKTLSVVGLHNEYSYAGGIDYSDCYIEIITKDENFKNWHDKIRPTISVKADLSIHDDETCDITHYNLYDVYPFECISHDDGHFTVRFKFYDCVYNKTASNKDSKSMLVENATRLIKTIDSIDAFIKSNDELYSSGILSHDDGCSEDLTSLLVDQKELCYRKSVDILRQLLNGANYDR